MNEMTQLDRIELFCEVLEETDLEQVRGYYAHDGGFCAFGALGETLVRRCVHGWSFDRHDKNNDGEVLKWINEGRSTPGLTKWDGTVSLNNPIGIRLANRYYRCDVKRLLSDDRIWIRKTVVELNDFLKTSFSEIAALIRLEFNLPKAAPPLLALIEEPEDKPQDDPLPQPMRPVQVKRQRELEPA